MRKELAGILRDKIVHMSYKPGEALNENRLAEEFQVSRTPVRQALQRLAIEGLVVITPNLGARVAEINLRDFRELIELRIILERGAAPLVARNADSRDIEAMKRLQASVEAENTGDLDRLTDLDSQFHLIIRRATHNQLLAQHMALIQTKFSWVMRLIDHRARMARLELPGFISAMERRDAAWLERKLVEHVEGFVEKMREAAGTPF